MHEKFEMFTFFASKTAKKFENRLRENTVLGHHKLRKYVL